MDADVSAQEYEALVLEALRQLCNQKGKPFRTYVRESRWEFDGYAPEGIDDLSGSTVIELKRRINRTDQWKRTLDFLFKAAREVNAETALLICGEPMSEQLTRDIRRYAAQWSTPPGFVLWTSDRVETLIKGIVKLAAGASPKLSAAAVNQIVEEGISPPGKPTIDSHVADLRNAYVSDNLVLFLGAGVSCSAGAPNWEAMLFALLHALVKLHASDLDVSESDATSLAKALRKRYDSPLQLARFIKEGLGDGFAETIHRALYRKVANTSLLLRSIARLCVTRQNGIRAIVTYNFDDLLERELDDLGRRAGAIYRENDRARAGEIGVYHVHGFLPREYRKEEVADSLLVFSEDGYHRVFSDAYSWSNIVQLGLLRESVGLFIGLSATDPNLRRLAEISAQRMTQRGTQLPRHYIVLKRSPLSAAEDLKQVSSDISALFDRVQQGLEEAALRGLGLNVIWVQDYAEIPELLDAIRS